MTTMESPVVVTVLMVLVLVAGGASEAATCNGKQLAPCVPALTGSVGTPTAECCSSMKAQQGCLCQFARNPAYARYVGNPNTRRTITACGISLPHCRQPF